VIQISASSLKDILVCPKRVYYRINHGGESVSSEEMQTGTIVHKVIETYWDNKTAGLKLLEDEIIKYKVEDAKLLRRARKCTDNFYKGYSSSLGAKDEVEKYFKVQYTKNIVFVGKIDRIHNNVVYDWKTSELPPEDINRDAQFIMYYLAYKKMYDREPTALVYASLFSNKRYIFKPEERYINEFEKKVIPFVVATIKDNTFPRNGLFNFMACKRCSFKELCYQDLEEDK
jgi:CRISPR/Cas system-associated exonuclease Cas4 (RecB family)